jgi:hypothetical protein
MEGEHHWTGGRGRGHRQLGALEVFGSPERPDATDVIWSVLRLPPPIPARPLVDPAGPATRAWAPREASVLPSRDVMSE